MKKLLVLSVLLGLLALPVFAEHATIDFGGDDSFGFISDFGSALVVDTSLTWDVIVGIDDYNSFTWSLADFSSAGLITLDKALVTTDIGMWAGLPIGLHVMWGYDDPDMNEFQVVSGYETEGVPNFSPTEYWGLGLIVAASFFEVELAFDPAGLDGKLLAGVAVKEPIPGLNAEFYYFQDESAGDVFDEGKINFDVGYATEVAGIGLEAGAFFWYNLSDVGPAYYYGFGLAGTYSIAELTVGLNGFEDEALDGLSFTLDVDALEMLAIYAGAEFLLSAADTFLGADLGLNAHVGAVEVYLGYLISENGAGGDYNAPATQPDGGAYVKFDVDY
jgi:hypothetical protein